MIDSIVRLLKEDKYYKYIVFHIILFSVVFFILNKTTHNVFFSEQKQLMQWDAWWYFSIKENGYSFDAAKQSNVAFFPLFPAVWKYSMLGEAGMSILNFIFFLSGLLLLIHHFPLKSRIFLIFLALPCILFFFVPYSESLFFLFSAIFLVGVKKNNWLLSSLAIFAAILTRSAGTIFIPALIGTAILFITKENYKRILLQFGGYVASCILATFTVIYIQYLKTNVWFATFQTHKYWDHRLGIPILPLRTWGNSELLRLDGTAMLIGLTSLAVVGYLLLRKYKDKLPDTVHSVEIFSLLYLGGVSMSILLFQGGDLHSINRYVFATPFYYLFLRYFESYKFNDRQLILLFVFLLLYFLLMGSYGHITTFLSFGLVALLIVMVAALNTFPDKVKPWMYVLVYIICTFWQAYFFMKYLNGHWIG